MTQFPAAVKNSFLAVTSAPPVGGEYGRGSWVGWLVGVGGTSVGLDETLSAVGEEPISVGVGGAEAGPLQALTVKVRSKAITIKIKFLFIIEPSEIY